MQGYKITMIKFHNALLLWFLYCFNSFFCYLIIITVDVNLFFITSLLHSNFIHKYRNFKICSDFNNCAAKCCIGAANTA